MNSTRVLCVENQPRCLVSLIELLQAAGYEAIPATSAAQALQILIEEDFEGILWNTIAGSDGTAVQAKNETPFPAGSAGDVIYGLRQ